MGILALDALQAAILDVKLSYLSRWTELRREHARFYDKNLPSSVGRIIEAKGAKHVYYMYVVRVPQREAMLAYLKEQGISCGIHYPVPLHLQPPYASYGFRKGQFPVAEKLASEIMSIPLYPELTEKQLQYVVNHIKKFMQR